MLQVQTLHLAESYMNDADCHSYIRRLLALPFLPAEHIPPMMTRLREEASHTDTYDRLLDYMQNTWIDSTLWTSTRWRVFYRTTCTRTKQRRREVAPSRKPECTERSAAHLHHDQLLFQEATTVNL